MTAGQLAVAILLIVELVRSLLHLWRSVQMRRLLDKLDVRDRELGARREQRYLRFMKQEQKEY